MSTSQLRCQGPQRQAFGRLANATTLRVISRPGTGHRVSSVAVLAKTTGGTKGDLDARRKKQLEKQKMRQLLEKTPIISRLLDGPLIMVCGAHEHGGMPCYSLAVLPAYQLSFWHQCTQGYAACKAAVAHSHRRAMLS